GRTTICTSVAGAPNTAGGAVNTSDARPVASVTRLRADQHPKSVVTPPTAVSARRDRFRIGWPLLSRAVIDTNDCDAPSCVNTSGDTLMSIAVPSSDGPVRDGVSCF